MGNHRFLTLAALFVALLVILGIAGHHEGSTVAFAQEPSPTASATPLASASPSTATPMPPTVTSTALPAAPTATSTAPPAAPTATFTPAPATQTSTPVFPSPTATSTSTPIAPPTPTATPNPEPAATCPQLGSEIVATDRSVYGPGATVQIAGSGYASACKLTIRVTRPNGSVVVGDGSFTPGMDTVSTNLAGDFTYDYILNGIAGEYKVEALGLNGVVLATTTFLDGPEILNPDIVPGWRPQGTLSAFSVLVRNTGDTGLRCITVTLPAGYTSISVGTPAASSGAWSGSVTGQVVTLSSSTAIAASGGWIRADISSTTPASASNVDWNLAGRPNQNCGGSGTATESVQVIVNNSQPADRRYSAAFVDGSGDPTTTPNFSTGARIRMTKLDDGQSNKTEFFAIALPRCFSSIAVTNHGENSRNGQDWSATVTDNFIRWRDSQGSGELDDFPAGVDDSVTLTFTANTSGCASGTYSLHSSGWQDNVGSSPDATKLFTTSAHPSAVIAPANIAPVCTNQSGSTNEDTALNGNLVCTDANGNTLTYSKVSDPLHGSVNINGGGSFTYTPAVDYCNEDSFTFRAHDGAVFSNTATFSVSVTCINDAPVAVADAYSVNEGGTLNQAAPGVLANDTDTESNTLTAQKLTEPANGTVTLNSNGSFSYAHNGSETASDSFTYRACDNGTSGSPAMPDPKCSGPTTVNITVNAVNDAPVANAGGDYSGAEGSAVSLNGSVTDPDSTPTTMWTYAPNGSVDIGTSCVFGDATSVDTTFTCNDDGTFIVTLTANDGVAPAVMDQATVVVGNMAPTATFANGGAVQEGSTGSVGVSNQDDASMNDEAAGFRYAYDFDNDGTFEIGDGTYVGGSTSDSATVPASYLADGPSSRTVRGRILDNDGGFTDYTTTITINNVAPTISLTGSNNVNESSSYSLTLGSVTDPGQDTVSGYSINWGDGVIETFTGPPMGATKTHTYADGPNSYSISVSLTDEDGTFAGGSKAVTVDNVAPSVAATNATVTVDEGQTANNAGSFSDPGVDTVSVTASVGAILQTGTQSGTWSWSYAATDGPDQSQTVTITATDSDGAFNTTTFALTVNNVAPGVAATNATVTVDEGQTANNAGSFSDPGVDTVSVTASVGAILQTGTQSGTWSWSYAATDGPDQSQTVTITATDSDGAFNTTTFALTANNVAPSVAATNATVKVDEGQTANNAGTFSDPGADTVGVTASVGTVTYSPNTNNGNWSWSFATTDGPDENQTVTITATDSDGASSTTTFSLIVNNIAPVITSFVGPMGPSSVGTAMGPYTATFTDAGTGDTHTCLFDWGDGGTSSGTVSEAAGSGSCSASHVYTTQNLYDITVTVTDDDGETDTAVITMVVIFDPDGGFVTGGGWIMSPAGAYSSDISLSGRANFGFVSKYKRGADTPTGQTEFQFKAGNLNFHSSDYEWLVVAGAKAQYKGTGTVNGVPGYQFMLSAMDGQENGGGGVDKFRIKIWNAGGVIYDNKMGAPDNDVPTTSLGGGSIVIHK